MMKQIIPIKKHLVAKNIQKSILYIEFMIFNLMNLMNLMNPYSTKFLNFF